MFRRISRRDLLRDAGASAFGLTLCGSDAILGNQANAGLPRNAIAAQGSPGNTAAEWAIKAGRLIDGTESTPIANGLLLVRGDRIAAVGSEAEVKLPAHVQIYDLGNETVLPGLIDTHNHLTPRPIGHEGTGMSEYVGQFRDPEALMTARAVRDLRMNLLSGVTTVRVVGELNFIDVSLATAVEQGLDVPGPRILPSGPRLSPTGGHNWIPEWAVDGPENIRHRIREYVSRGSRLIKIGLLDEGPDQTSYNDEELSAVATEAHGLGVPVTAHCTGLWGSSIRHAVKAGVDVIEHVVPLNDQIIELVLKNGTGLSLTPWQYRMPYPQPAQYWHFGDFEARSAKEWMDYNAERGQDFIKAHPEVMTQNRLFVREVMPALGPWMNAVQQAWKAGVPVAVGSDTPPGVLPLSVEFLVDCGLPPLDAIRAATRVAAKISKVEETTGTLSVGKSADFISVRGDPLKDIKILRDVHFVVRGGVRFENLSFA
jgi:imidazolonepropionase-like amidohydrolase